MFHLYLPLLVLFAAYGTSSLLIRRMIAVAVIDIPGHRSAHASPTPKGGGVGVVVAFLLFLVPLRGLCGLPPLTMEVGGLWSAVTLLAIVSWLDDVYQWSPLIKLAAQILAAVIVTLTALPVDGFAGITGLCVAAVVSVGWLVFVANAVNFMDGLNGLVSGVLCLSFLALALPFWPGDSQDLRVASALTAFGLLAFLPFNFPNARIFLGDVGSQSGGLLIGAAALSLATHGPMALPPDLHAALLVPCLTGGLLYDVTITLIRRALAGEKILEAHRGHLYQVAYRSGVPKTAVSLVHWGFVIWGGCAFAMTAMPGFRLSEGGGGVAITLVLVALPQLLWTAFVLWRVKRHPVGRW